jgi:hypothetical protein
VTMVRIKNNFHNRSSISNLSECRGWENFPRSLPKKLMTFTIKPPKVERDKPIAKAEDSTEEKHDDTNHTSTKAGTANQPINKLPITENKRVEPSEEDHEYDNVVAVI